jgi:hypothetical protein
VSNESYGIKVGYGAGGSSGMNNKLLAGDAQVHRPWPSAISRCGHALPCGRSDAALSRLPDHSLAVTLTRALPAGKLQGGRKGSCCS